MALNLSAVFFYVKDFNAKGDGKTKDTSAINKAIEVCSESGGGTVYFPAGTYLTGPVNLKSNIVLYIDAGANILFSDDFDDYPAVWTRWGGCECYAYSPLIFAYGCSNVTITGRGTVDGQGAAWWKVYKERMGSGRLYPVTERDKEFAELNIACTAHGSGGGGWKSQFLRPPLIQIMKCSNVVIEGVTLKNSPFWNTHLLYSDGIVVNGVTILNPHDAPNGDGIDIDSCKNVRISDSFIDAGDDCICLKSGMDEDGRRVGMPTENIAVTNCILNHGHGGIVMGSDVSGGIRNVVVSNCTFIDTDRGIRIKANRARGGVVEDIQVSNVNMKRVFSPLVIHAYYCCGESPDNSFLFDKTTKPVTEKTPVFKNIHLSGVSAREVTASAGFIYGIPELPVENVTLTNVNIEMTQNPD
ncbi:MAG: glycoside hydrolase family 28 protein [Bacillota bacterium]|nr:glycoside hydrolase family 28 protein [Bacillota bacterium]